MNFIDDTGQDLLGIQPGYKNVKGKCYQMCPQAESTLRIEEHLVHRLEFDDRGQPANLVKEFRRSAAGHIQAKPSDLRPPQVCLRTAQHLIENVLSKNEFNLFVYNFIFDRLRSVRQDLVVQGNPDLGVSIKVLQICVRFHLLSSYQLGTKLQQSFDSTFNFTQLLECLKALLLFYDLERTRDSVGPSEVSVRSEYVEAAAIYLLLNVGSPHSLAWGLKLDRVIKAQPVMRLATKLNMLYLERNFVGFFKRMLRLPLLLKLAAHWNLPHIISSMLAVMNSGFSSKACKYPIRHFMELTLTKYEGHARQFCGAHEIPITEVNDERYIGFLKTNFKSEPKLPRVPLQTIEDDLQDSSFSLKEFFLL